MMKVGINQNRTFYNLSRTNTSIHRHFRHTTKFLFIWQSGTEKKIYRNRPIRNKNCLWQPYLLMDRDKMGNLYRGHLIDASYQVSVHLAKRFQRKIFFKKSNNKKEELSMTAMFVNGSKRNEQFPQRTFHRCFGPFGQAVSEQKIFRNRPI